MIGMFSTPCWSQFAVPCEVPEISLETLPSTTSSLGGLLM